MAYDKNNPVNNGWATVGQVTDAGAGGLLTGGTKGLTDAGLSAAKNAINSVGGVPAASNGTFSAIDYGNGAGIPVTNYIGPAMVAYDYAKTGLTDALNRDLSDWRNGAKTGASIGSAGGPIGTVTGAVIGGLTGLAGSAAGIGKTKNKGYSPISGTYNQNGDMSLLGVKETGAKRYGSYNDAMNYLNGVNQQWNSDWSKIGDSEYGQYDLATKTADPYSTEAMVGFALGGLPGLVGGSILGAKDKHNYVDAYKANLNTGYNVMDDFTRGSNYIGDTGNLDLGWKPYQSQQDRIYQERYGNLAKANQEGLVNSIGNNAGSLASSVDQQQYDTAKRKLDQQLARGYLDQSGYSKALSQLNDNRSANRKALLDIGNNQIDQWKTDLRQEYQNRLDSDLTDDWIKNYNAWKSDDMSGLYNDANRAADLYLQNTISDDYLRSLMGQSNMYNPYQYMATGIADSNSGLGMADWTGNRRKRPASLVYEGE